MQKTSKLIICFLLAFGAAGGQSLDSLSLLIKEIQRGKNDSVRVLANNKFLSEFEKELQKPGSINKNFDSLKSVSIQKPEDGAFRIYTWVLPYYDGKEYNYFGFLQVHYEGGDTLIRLRDSTNAILKPESEKLRPDKWFGAIYYSIIPSIKSGKQYYTLLGWKGKNQDQTQKVMEVLYFTGKQPKFGFPLFKSGSVFHNRVLFTYNSQATMTLRYDKKVNGIVLDHISTDKMNPSLAGPDGTYDTYKLKKGKWVLSRDKDVRTKWEPNETLPVPPVDEK